jgi:hypothetical protein
MPSDVVYIVNPETNPRRRRKVNRRGRHVRRAAPAVNRRPRRANPAGGYLMTVNPRRRRSSRRRRRSYRRNPSLKGLVGFRGVSPKSILWATAGMIGVQTLTPAILKMVKQPATGPIALVGKVVTAMLGSFAIGSFLKNKQAAQSFMLGGMISVGTDVWSVYIKPRLGLGGMYEFDSSPGMLGGGVGQTYMFEEMDRALLGDVGGCVPSERYLNPTDQVIVGGSAGGAGGTGSAPRMNQPTGYPYRLTPVV